MTEKILQNNPHPLGAHIESNGIRFSFVSRNASCGILLYDRKTGRLQKKIPFADVDRIGNIYCKKVEGIDPESCTYLFFQEDKIVPDERARVFPVKVTYGKARNGEDFKAGFLTNGFDWGEDRFPRIPYDRALGYCMHVRGFTKHASSNVKYKGTFAGITEKIPYLKGIGITTIELQPAYEFTEIPLKEEGAQNIPYMMEPGLLENVCRTKLNYWGYKKGYYYAPKAAYAGKRHSPILELKNLVKELHRAGIELVIELFFTGQESPVFVLDMVRRWVREYHLDGVHLVGTAPTGLLASDPYLAGTKLWASYWDERDMPAKGERHLGEYNDGFLTEMRRVLKGDEGQMNALAYRSRCNPTGCGILNYMANTNGFTLMDLVSYEQKHNEENGERNQDGSSQNYSWNCGVEGPVRKKKVTELRRQQLRNSFLLLFLSQGTPLFMAGDEFGNSQKGNNNAYCQDNEISWLNWNQTRTNGDLLEFVKAVIAFRKAHPVFHGKREPRLMDYEACGFPDVSYHGVKAWAPEFDPFRRQLGILYCGSYGKRPDGTEDDYFFVAYNMHWEPHEFALPHLPKGMTWHVAFDTGDREHNGYFEPGKEPEAENQKQLMAPARTILVMIGKMKASKEE